MERMYILVLALALLTGLAGLVSAADQELRMGVYIYDYSFKKTAQAYGEELKPFVEKHFQILQKHHVNTLHLTVYRPEKNNPDFAEVWLPMLKKYGIKAYLQLDFAYYTEPSTKKKGWSPKFEDHQAKLAAEFIRKYQNEPAILAFSIREEVPQPYAAGMARYYQKIRNGAPDFKIVTVHNNLGAAKSHPEPYPAVLGADRYCFWWEFSGEGYLASPAFALNWLRNQSAQYQEQAAKRGADFLLVLTSNAYAMGRVNSENAWKKGKMSERIKLYTADKRFGWNLDTVNGKEINWVWKWYRPPVNCTRAMIWTGILEGARGILFWSYQPTFPNGPKSPAEMLERSMTKRAKTKAEGSWSSMAGRPGESNQPLEEFAAAAEELKPYSKLVCMMDKLPKSPVKTDAKKRIYNRAFEVKDCPGKIVVIHNANVGTWGANSKVFFSDKDDIRVDGNGDLVGYTPFTGRKPVEFTCDGKDEVFDFATGKKLELNTGKGTVELLPGGGTVLFLGTAQDLAKLQNMAKVN
ncbi:MAG: hypothetical protein IJS14_06450 [Lentisphaeria bacterium]|nr:hypothetical protein [Lentisphaeria bacterium]